MARTTAFLFLACALLVGTCLCGCYSMPSQPQPIPGFVLSFGGHFSSEPGQFKQPSGIAVDLAGNVYVVDQGNYRVQKFTSRGEFITQWGTRGTGDGQFTHVGRIAVDRSGFVYTTEIQLYNGEGITRIQKFTSTGEHVASFGSRGSGPGQFIDPVGIAVDPSGNLYVVDHGNHRVQKLTNEGDFLAAWGDSGSDQGHFDYALEIAIDGQGHVFVTDVGALNSSSRIQKFDSEGRFLLQFGELGSGDGQFAEPKGIAVNERGEVYVADGPVSRVQKFTNDGVFLSKWGSFGFEPGHLNFPFGLATHGPRDVFVLEPFNYRVSKFRLGGVPSRFLTAPLP